MRVTSPPVPLCCAVLALGALLVPAAGQALTVRDRAGRAIEFDVHAKGADVPGYARILLGAAHGAEMQGLTIRVTSLARLRAACHDAQAAGCYERGRGGAVIMIPPQPALQVKAVLLHEYGHHVDATRATPRWWAARNMSWRLRTGQVARDYSRGWSRSVGEIFAEDYVALNMPHRSLVRWLPAPSRAVLQALRRDLTGRATGEPPAVDPTVDRAPPVTGTVVSRVTRTGEVGRGRVLEASVPLDAADRLVRVTVRGEPSLGEVPIGIEFTCDGMTPGSYALAPGQTSYLRAGPIGPGTCAVRLTGPADAVGGASLEMVVATATTGG